jgi:hypothetical protein
MVKTGVPSNDPGGSVLLLLKFLADPRSLKGRKGEIEKYAKTEQALEAFLTGRIVQRLKGTEEELFKLPEEIRRGTVAAA